MKPLLTLPEVCELLRLPRSTVYQRVREGKLRAVRIGRGMRFAAEDVEAFVRRSTDAGVVTDYELIKGGRK